MMLLKESQTLEFESDRESWAYSLE